MVLFGFVLVCSQVCIPNSFDSLCFYSWKLDLYPVLTFGFGSTLFCFLIAMWISVKWCTVFIIHRLINVKRRFPTFIITLACNCASILRRKTPSDDEMQIARNAMREKVVPSNTHFSKMPSSKSVYPLTFLSSSLNFTLLYNCRF